MGSGLLGIGTSALLAYQRALDTVGHNVANVNTPGYSRQGVELASRIPQIGNGGFIGSGVDVKTVSRSFNQFITNDLRTATTNLNESGVLARLAGDLDNLLADSNSGLSPVLGSFFDAVQDVSNDPGSIAARQVVLGEASSLASRFHALDNWFSDAQRSLNTRMATVTGEVNQLAASIADVNQKIIEAESSSGGQPPNDLLDARDQLVLELSELVAITTTSQEDGALNVFIGSGQSLVLGVQNNELNLVNDPGDPGQFDITISSAGSTPVIVTNLINGGELGGMVRHRAQVLDPAYNELGRLAIELGTFINEQHRSGVSLDGQPGQDMFSIAAPAVIPAPGSAATVSVAFDDVSQLTAKNYLLDFDGAAWRLRHADSGQVVSMTGSGTTADPFVADGLSIDVGGGALAGDSYTIRPVRDAAASINLLTSGPRELALASPVQTAAVPGNTGTGRIGAGEVTDIGNAAFQSPPGQLTPPVTIRFTSPTSYEIVDTSSAAVIDTGSYDPATGTDVFPTGGGTDFGYRVRLTGNPAAGDEFNVTYNSSGTGDNRNALLLAGLQTEPLMNGGTTSFTDAYGELVAGVGTQARQAQVNSGVHAAVLQQHEAAWAGASGVNLDEEAANLMRFQQAYQAAAQVISVADSLFDTLIGAIRN